MPYLSASVVVIHYEEALYQVYVPCFRDVSCVGTIQIDITFTFTYYLQMSVHPKRIILMIILDYWSRYIFPHCHGNWIQKKLRRKASFLPLEAYAAIYSKMRLQIAFTSPRQMYNICYHPHESPAAAVSIPEGLSWHLCVSVSVPVWFQWNPLVPFPSPLTALYHEPVICNEDPWLSQSSRFHGWRRSWENLPRLKTAYCAKNYVIVVHVTHLS